MNKDYPFISIIVVTKNEERNIGPCISSIMQSDYPSDKYEVLIVDGGSIDRTIEIASSFVVRVVIDSKGGLAHSRNLGLEYSRGDYIVSTDADCIVDVSWLRRLVDSIQIAPRDVVAVGGPNLVFNEDVEFAKIVGYMQESFFASGGSPQSYKISGDRYVMSIHNCNVIYRRKVLLEEMGYNNSLNVAEDAELNFRLWSKGYRFLYKPNIIVWHRRPSDMRGFLKKMFRYGEGMGKITAMHGRVVRWYAFVPMLVIISILLMVPLSVIYHPVFYLYGLAILLYAGLLAYSAFEVYCKLRCWKSLLVFLLMPLQHTVYGLGFAKGIIQK